MLWLAVKGGMFVAAERFVSIASRLQQPPTMLLLLLRLLKNLRFNCIVRTDRTETTRDDLGVIINFCFQEIIHSIVNYIN